MSRPLRVLQVCARFRPDLGGIETQQALNLLAQLHGEALSLQIPFFAGQQPTTAYLSVEADGLPGG